jgi:hypothetical protein
MHVGKVEGVSVIGKPNNAYTVGGVIPILENGCGCRAEIFGICVTG